MNKFPTYVQPHDDINKYYYIVALPTNIFVFVKRYEKETLVLKFVKALVVENDLRSIGVILDSNDCKDSKDVGKKTQVLLSENIVSIQSC